MEVTNLGEKARSVMRAIGMEWWIVKEDATSPLLRRRFTEPRSELDEGTAVEMDNGRNNIHTVKHSLNEYKIIRAGEIHAN